VPQRFHVTQQRAWGEQHLFAPITRFIPPDLLALFNVVPPPAPTQQPAMATQDAPPLFNLRERPRGF
jgi:DNA helicase II / ATP-dependent DNA helicase PcrA